MDHSKVIARLDSDSQRLHLTLNAPKANILDGEMLGALTDAVRKHRDSPTLKVIVFEGAGRHFSFGASVEEHRADNVSAMLSQFHGFFALLAETAIPTMAVVRGQCLGGGLELASYCSWIFAAPDAHFGQPEIKLAVFPPMASVLLPWRVGGANALDLCISGRSISADAAKRISLVHEVNEEPAAAALAFFDEHLATTSASSLRFAERATRLSLARAIERDLPAAERLYLDELMKTHDANEGITAFLERRQPSYSHSGAAARGEQR